MTTLPTYHRCPACRDLGRDYADYISADLCAMCEDAGAAECAVCGGWVAKKNLTAEGQCVTCALLDAPIYVGERL